MVNLKLSRLLGWMLVAFTGVAFAGAVQAAAVLSKVTGDVRTSIAGGAASPAALNEQLEPGTSVLTGGDAQAVIKFDDGQVVVLDQNTTFKLADFQYNAQKPAEGRVVMDLLKGALRAITGLIGRANHQAFALRVPQATIGIRGTDFMVALVNPAYTSVLQGSIGVTNGGGTTVFGAGSLGAVTSTTALPVVIPASQLPGAAAAAFSRLSALSVGALGGLAGGVGEGAVAEEPSDVSKFVVFGAVAAGVVAAGVNGSGGSSNTTTHH
jgi:FecR protein